MSTKIFHGCRAPRSMDVMELADQVRSVITPLRRDLERKMVMTSCAEIIDREAMQQVPRSGDAGEALRTMSLWSPFFRAMDEYDRTQKELGEQSALHDPYRFSMQVIASGDHLYLLPFVRQEVYIDALSRIEGVEHYPYWNNADGPEELTEEQWDDRGREWMSVPGLDYGEIPAQHGVTIDLGMDNNPTFNLLLEIRNEDSPALLAQQPDLQTRRIQVIRRAVHSLRPLTSGVEGAWGHVRQMQRHAKALAEIEGIISDLQPLTIDMVRGNQMHPPIWINWRLLLESLRSLEEDREEQ